MEGGEREGDETIKIIYFFERSFSIDFFIRSIDGSHYFVVYSEILLVVIGSPRPTLTVAS